MIYYVFLALASLCFAIQFLFTRVYEKQVGQSFVTVHLLLIVTGLVGAILFLFVNRFSIHYSGVSAFWAVVMAVVMVPYYMLGIKVLGLGSLAVYSMFMMLGGMLLPFFYGILWLNESVTVGKILGVLLLSFSIVWQAFSQMDPTTHGIGRQKKIFFILCACIFVINGLTGVIAKIHEISDDAVDEGSFTFLSCLITAVIGMVLLCLSSLKNRERVKSQLKPVLRIRIIATMFALGAATYTGNFLLLKAASHIPASVQFPVVSGGVIVLSALVSLWIFKEKISKKEWISILVAFAATVSFAF